MSLKNIENMYQNPSLGIPIEPGPIEQMMTKE